MLYNLLWIYLEQQVVNILSIEKKCVNYKYEKMHTIQNKMQFNVSRLD